MTELILRVDASGQPLGWMPWQDAVVVYVKEQVLWASGGNRLRIRGGMNRETGSTSYVDIDPIVAVRGRVDYAAMRTSMSPLTNRELFRRDRHTCLYCLMVWSDRELTRDHVVPLSRNGTDTWSNVATACRVCNQRKGARTPDEANMRLHAVPYAPSHAEWLILRNRRILADQMKFLAAYCPKGSRWREKLYREGELQ